MNIRYLVICILLVIGYPAALVSADSDNESKTAVLLAANFSGDAELPQSQNEAKLWILNAGYDQVSHLKITRSGAYHGTALSRGETYYVSIDLAGNVLGIKE